MAHSWHEVREELGDSTCENVHHLKHQQSIVNFQRAFIKYTLNVDLFFKYSSLQGFHLLNSFNGDNFVIFIYLLNFSVVDDGSFFFFYLSITTIWRSPRKETSRKLKQHKLPTPLTTMGQLESHILYFYQNWKVKNKWQYDYNVYWQ